MSKGMLIDGIAASAAIDAAGEVLDVGGVDLTVFESGRAPLDWEHKNGADSSPSDIIGKVVFCKKIFSEKDCADERQLMYWKQVQLPYIYVICRLYDAAGHPEAIAAAAQIRDHVANNEPINIRFSIEGKHIEREGPFLKKTIALALAATLRPCNDSCDSGVLLDPSQQKEEKKVKEEKETQEDSVKKYLASAEYVYVPFIDSNEPAEEVKKAISAGGMDAAPSQLVGGSALQKEELPSEEDAMLNLGIEIEMQGGLDREQAEKVARANLSKDPNYYKDSKKSEIKPVSGDYLNLYAEMSEDLKAPATREQTIRKFENWTVEIRKVLSLL